MRKALMLLTIVLLPLLAVRAFGAGTTFKAVIKNDSVVTNSSFFTVNLYCTNNDSISPPPYENRMTWVSPFSFKGIISIDWLDATLTNDVAYSDSVTMTKFATAQFYNYWDMYRDIYVESWGDGLPDRFSFTGIAMNYGFPPQSDSIPILSWHAKTTNDSGYFCMEKGNMTNNTYDWLFDNPEPNFTMQCWKIEGDTFRVTDLSVPVLDTIIDTIRVFPGATLTIPGIVVYEKIFLADTTVDSASATIHATDPGETITLSYSPTLDRATFTDNGNGNGRFVYKPNFTDVGYHEVNFIAFNGLFADSERVVFNVKKVNAPPNIVDMGNKTVKEHDSLIINLSATDIDGDSLTFDYSPDLPGAFIEYKSKTSATFKFYPDESQGETVDTVWLTVHDQGNLQGWDSDRVIITVVEVNDPPVLAYIGDKTVKAGSMLKIDVYATDPEGAEVTLSTSTLPSGASFVDSGKGHGLFEYIAAPGPAKSAEYAVERPAQLLLKALGDFVFNISFYASDGNRADTEVVNITAIGGTTDIKEIQSSQLPAKFSLKQNYPNPFNPSTVIEFAVPAASHVNLSVFNILGQIVVTLVNEDLPAGYKSIIWNGENETGSQVASGVYFYRLEANDFKATKRLILMK